MDSERESNLIYMSQLFSGQHVYRALVYHRLAVSTHSLTITWLGERCTPGRLLCADAQNMSQSP